MNDQTQTESLETIEKPPGRAARQGKIARLPAAVRNELNRRLLDGEKGTALVQWLNELPEVQAVLQNQFGGRPILEQNLSEWRQGGFKDWVAKSEAADWLADTLDEVPEPAEGMAGSGEPADGKGQVECLADRVAKWFFPHYVAVARGRLAAADTLDERWTVIRTICSDLSGLRRNEHYVERLKIWREKLNVEIDESEGSMAEKFVKWARAQKDVEQLIWPERRKLTPRQKEAKVKQILGIS